MCELNFFPTGINSSSELIQNEGSWLCDFTRLHFTISKYVKTLICFGNKFLLNMKTHCTLIKLLLRNMKLAPNILPQIMYKKDQHFYIYTNTHGGAMPMACRLARATRLCGPVFPKAPRIPGFMASVDWILACSSAALRAFSIASFMKLAAWEGAMDWVAPTAGRMGRGALESVWDGISLDYRSENKSLVSIFKA